MTSITASLLLVGCVDYSIQDPDADAVLPTVYEERFVQTPLPKLDILFVVDSTGSMAEEQASFADAADSFVAVLEQRAVAYQLGVTTTDPALDGALLGRPWIITGAAGDPSDALAAALEVGSDSPPPAAGLYSASRALADPQGVNRGFRRPDASLHVVFVSDGDDASDDLFGEDPATAFLAVLAEDAARSGRTARASAVVGDAPAGCSGSAGVAQAGVRYREVAAATGGVSASICEADFAAVASALGDAGVEWPTVFPLRALPADGTLLVEVDGDRVLEGWSLDTTAPALVFAVAPAPDSVIDVLYTVAEAP